MIWSINLTIDVNSNIRSILRQWSNMEWIKHVCFPIINVLRTCVNYSWILNLRLALYKTFQPLRRYCKGPVFVDVVQRVCARCARCWLTEHNTLGNTAEQPLCSAVLRLLLPPICFPYFNTHTTYLHYIFSSA